MSKPSIGTAVTIGNVIEKKEIEELTVLKDNSEESIFNLIFSEKGSLKKNEK